MTIWTALILGLLVGWLVEWVVDWVYWRQRSQRSQAELAALRGQSQRIKLDLEASLGSTNALKTELSAMRHNHTTAEREHERLRSELDVTNSSLKRYKSEVENLTAELSAARDDVDRLRAAGNAASPRTLVLPTDGTPRAEAGESAELARLHAELAAAQQDLGQLRSQLQSAPHPSPIRRDALINIKGIEPEYEKRLFAAGIYSFVDLAAQPPQRLRDIVAHEGQEIEAEAWIAEANQLAHQSAFQQQALAVGERRRDPLVDINGIGPVYEKRLFAAGIYSFADLAAQSPARLREIVAAAYWQDVDTEAWIAEAGRFAQATSRKAAR